MLSAVTIHDAPVAEIDSTTLYRLLALRVDVFVVEQTCAYRELDGRDLEPLARLVWAERDREPISTLRLLLDPDGTARIGRVATAISARSDGVAARLMERALRLAEQLAPGRDVVLDAQLRLFDWYGRFGFERDGADYEEDGIGTRPDAPNRRPSDWKLIHDTSYLASPGIDAGSRLCPDMSGSTIM